MSIRWPKLLLLLALLVTTGCGGDDDDGNGSPTGPENPEGSRVSATIDGQSWSADFVTEVRQGGIIAIGGAEVGGTLGLGIGFADSGAETFMIGPTEIANGNVTQGADSWQANAAVGSGTITVTTLTSDRAVGTFSFTAMAFTQGTTPAERVVTNGSFDIVFK
jgi:hypothetical protein